MKLCIASANNKGGVGKSTTAALVSAALATPQFRVAIVDLDKQGTCRAWAQAGQGQIRPYGRSSHSGYAQGSPRRHRRRARHARLPPTADAPETLAALGVADLLMVPATPSAPDYWSTDEMLITARIHYPNLAYLVVLNQMTPTTLSSEMEELFRKTWPNGVAQQTLAFRTAYREAAAHGVGLHQLPGRKGPYEPAVRELEKVAVEVLTTALGRK